MGMKLFISYSTSVFPCFFFFNFDCPVSLLQYAGFHGGSDTKKITCKVGDLGSDPWEGKIPWRRARQPTPVLLSGEFPWTEEPGRLQSCGCKESNTTESLNTVGCLVAVPEFSCPAACGIIAP